MGTGKFWELGAKRSRDGALLRQSVVTTLSILDLDFKPYLTSLAYSQSQMNDANRSTFMMMSLSSKDYFLN